MEDNIVLTIAEIAEPQQPQAEMSRYKKYIDAQKRANKKYRENNKQKFREISRNYYNNHKQEPEFQQRQRDKALKSYYKRKEIKNTEVENLVITI
jgi:hypothetical protein